jgi:hypothetical protein
MIQSFKDKGLGDIMSSWIGTGQNLAIGGDQLKTALGAALIGKLASKVGLSPDVATSKLTEILPGLIDKLTPEGKVPEPLHKVVSRNEGYGDRRYAGRLLHRPDCLHDGNDPGPEGSAHTDSPGPSLHRGGPALRRLDRSGNGRKENRRTPVPACPGRAHPVPPFLSAQYNPPWTIPPFRRNEIIVQIR